MSRLNLDLCNGPECPHCGCHDTEQRGFGHRWGYSVSRMVCRHCGTTFPIKDSTEPTSEQPPNGQHVIAESGPKLIVYPVILCPVDQGGCGSSSTKVTSTRRPMRHHKCRDCGFTFKSMEEVENGDR